MKNIHYQKRFGNFSLNHFHLLTIHNSIIQIFFNLKYDCQALPCLGIDMGIFVFFFLSFFSFLLVFVPFLSPIVLLSLFQRSFVHEVPMAFGQYVNRKGSKLANSSKIDKLYFSLKSFYNFKGDQHGILHQNKFTRFCIYFVKMIGITSSILKVAVKTVSSHSIHSPEELCEVLISAKNQHKPVHKAQNPSLYRFHTFW